MSNRFRRLITSVVDVIPEIVIFGGFHRDYVTGFWFSKLGLFLIYGKATGFP